VTEPQGLVHGDEPDRAAGPFDFFRLLSREVWNTVALHHTQSSTGRVGRLGPDVHDSDGQRERDAAAIQIAHDAIDLFLGRTAQI
jgi:hypothetical protein